MDRPRGGGGGRFNYRTNSRKPFFFFLACLDCSWETPLYEVRDTGQTYSVYNILLVSLPTLLLFSAYLKVNVVECLMATDYLNKARVSVGFKIPFQLKMQGLKWRGCAVKEKLNCWQFSAFDEPWQEDWSVCFRTSHQGATIESDECGSVLSSLGWHDSTRAGQV